eukprot:c24212_g1_i1 orf=330-1319(-)
MAFGFCSTVKIASTLMTQSPIRSAEAVFSQEARFPWWAKSSCCLLQIRAPPVVSLCRTRMYGIMKSVASSEDVKLLVGWPSGFHASALTTSEQGTSHAVLGSRMYGGEAGVQRPEVIEWKKEIANHVQLIGRMGRDIELTQLDLGRVVAKSCIIVPNPLKPREELRFEVEFCDDLAEITVAHLKKLDHVFISGQVIMVDTVLWKVLVSDVKFVVQKFFINSEGSTTSDVKFVADKFIDISEGNTTKSSSEVFAKSFGRSSGSKFKAAQKSNTEGLWKSYFENPSEWWDNRGNKRNPRGPDFKHKTTGEGLWVDSWSNPEWVKSQLELLE